MRTITDTKHVGSLRSAHRATSHVVGDNRSRHFLSLHGCQLSLDILQKERKTLSNRVSELDLQIHQLEEKIASLARDVMPSRKRRPTLDKKTESRQPILGIAVGVSHD